MPSHNEVTMSNHPQPETLPNTLPLGIKAAGLNLMSDARLIQTPTGPAYAGSWQDGNNLVAWDAPASQVDWGSVERPIQAGDWVECTKACGTIVDGIKEGERFRVARLEKFFDAPGLVLHCRGGIWIADRFKRVDGPHPERFSCKVCDQSHASAYEHQFNSADRGYCASCYQIAARKVRGAQDASVPVETVNAQPSKVGEAAKRDPYTEHSLHDQASRITTCDARPMRGRRVPAPASKPGHAPRSRGS
jgi:hypothetical protein